MERTVTVWGKPQTVQIKQSSRTSFTVSGSYMGRPLYAAGSSASAALAAWSAKARSEGERRA